MIYWRVKSSSSLSKNSMMRFYTPSASEWPSSSIYLQPVYHYLWRYCVSPFLTPYALHDQLLLDSSLRPAFSLQAICQNWSLALFFFRDNDDNLLFVFLKPVQMLSAPLTPLLSQGLSGSFSRWLPVIVHKYVGVLGTLQPGSKLQLKETIQLLYFCDLKIAHSLTSKVCYL